MTIPIEITIGKPSDISKRDQGRKSSIKSSQIMLRLYYSIKWNLLRGLPTILIIHKDWEQYEWVSKEQEFMKRFNCYVIFTNFKENWAKKVAQEIKRLTESSRFNKTTQLGSKSSSN
jgi:ribosome-binding ATPase YchF (GTP1/OBG family)